MTFRFANLDDAKALAMWAEQNPDIPGKDIEAALRTNNPTSVFLVIEDEGEVILSVPLYAVMRISCLLFNPKATKKQKLKAMAKMHQAIMVFAANFGINSVDTLSKEGYDVAKWAQRNGFRKEDRELFELKGFMDVQ